MDLPHALVEGLTLLSDALDDPLIDLEAVLDVLTDDLIGAVPMYLGLTITLHVEDSPVIRENLVAALEEMTPVDVVGTAEDEGTARLWLGRADNDCLCRTGCRGG